MMAGTRTLCALGCFAAQYQALGDAALDGTPERIAAHFEAFSSRLRNEDTAPLTQFVMKVGNIPGAKLAILVPTASDSSRARFVAARIAELERRVRQLAEGAELRKVPGNVGADIVWLEIVLPNPAAPIEKAVPAALQFPPSIKAEPLPAEQPPAKSVNAADLRLTDWVVRGVKHPPQGPTYAYVARTGAGETPREIVAQQIDKELGLVKDISLTPEGGWVVHTEIGWIGQVALASSLVTGGR